MVANFAFAAASENLLPLTRSEIIRDSARVTFEWQKPVSFHIAQKGNKITISFARKANPDVRDILSTLYPYIKNVEQKPDGKTIVLVTDKEYKIRKFMSDNIGGIEILGINPPQKQIAESAVNLAELAPAAGAEKDLKQLSRQTPEELGDAMATPSNVEAEKQEKLNKVTVSAGDDSATIRFPLKQRTATSVFIRNHHLWIVMAKPMDFDLSDFDYMEKTVIGKPKVISNGKNTIFYIPVDDNIYASLAKENDSNNIAVLLTQKSQPPPFPLSVDISTVPPAPPHVLVGALEVSDSITVRDPVIGDALIITPSFKIGEGVSFAREFIEFGLLKTSQGVATVKKADDVIVVNTRNGLRITTGKGATISPDLPKVDTKLIDESTEANPTLFPYELWKVEGIEKRRNLLRELFHKVVESDSSQDANNARLKMAQIYLGEGMAAEAIGMLDGINRSNPSFFRIAKLNSLRGAANFLMSRFPEAAKDFAAPELNNNKEIEYWRAVLAELLGSASQTYNYLAMNNDYISKYPPVFRQKLAIIAADRAISAKDYNIALKILDSLHQDNIAEAINVYINFLLAKISMYTGQEKEALDSLDKLAGNIKHPFVQARADFTIVAYEMENGLDKDAAIEKLERIRLNWHGDNLELQILTILGELYHEKKDYVNAMRVWNNGVESFQNTAAAINMQRKMEEAFIIMFNEGVADQLPPLEALALYYEYRRYMPRGTAGNEMLDRLADRLISMDLLKQATGLLEYQMRAQTEKERRSQIGARLAETYLMSKKPDKALAALQESVYGENPVLLRLKRNRLAAEIMVETGKPELALQILGQDDSAEAENIRINIYWRGKDWDNLAEHIENVLKNRSDITAPLNDRESSYLIKLALSYIFTDNKQQLQYLRDYFTPLMNKNKSFKLFEFVTNKDIIPNSRNFDEVIKEINTTRSFIESYKAEYQ